MPPLKIAHRGDHRLEIENTLAALKSAFDQGLDGVEFDVQLSANGTPWLFHDDSLARFWGDSTSLYQLEDTEIDKLRFKGKDYGLTRFAEVLLAFPQKLLYIELKVPEKKNKDEKYLHQLLNKTAALLKGFDLHPLSTIASFNLQLLEMSRQQNPHLRLTQIIETLEEEFTWRQRTYPAPFLSLPWQLLPSIQHPPLSTWVWDLSLESLSSHTSAPHLAWISDFWLD